MNKYSKKFFFKDIAFSREKFFEVLDANDEMITGCLNFLINNVENSIYNSGIEGFPGIIMNVNGLELFERNELCSF